MEEGAADDRVAGAGAAACGVNDARHAAYTAYLRLLAHHLNLTDWVIVLERAHHLGSSYARIEINHHKKEAGVTLSENFWGWTPEQQRKTLVHELLHLHTARLCRVMTRLHDQHDTDLVRYAEKALDEEEEIVIEQLARVIAPLMPLALDTNSDTNPTNAHQHGPTPPSVTTGLWESGDEKTA
jgi:hypothetical protein